jgi:hypothetical protein
MFGMERMTVSMVHLNTNHVAGNFQIVVAADLAAVVIHPIVVAQKEKIHCENFVGMMTRNDLAADGNSSSFDFLECFRVQEKKKKNTIKLN